MNNPAITLLQTEIEQNDERIFNMQLKLKLVNENELPHAQYKIRLMRLISERENANQSYFDAIVAIRQCTKI